MSNVARVLAAVAGASVALYVLLAAVRTVVVPRGEPVMLTRMVFQVLRGVFDLKLKRVTSYEDRDRAMAMYAPLGLVLLPGAWIALVTVAFTGVLWGLGVDPLRRAFTMSGSSILTLGFVVPPDLPTSVAAFMEATLGLGLLALLISYLPSIYGAFQRRELGVARMATLAGTPPSAVEMLTRYHALGRLAEIDELWDEWDRWFADIEETHTSQPSLVFFRSISHERSWLTAAAVVLDAAGFRAGVLDLPRNPRAEICLRSGYIALRRIAAYYSIPFDPAPDAADVISIERSEFLDAYDRLVEAGVPVRPDRQLAWEAWAGWRVNYDAALLGLTGLVQPPYAAWSSDRSLRYRRPPITRRGRARRMAGG